jgi:hypothetical protein
VARKPGKSLLTGAACAPLRDHLTAVRATSPLPTSWSQVEKGFLAAMAEFDGRVAGGNVSEGERQNGKGDYFNDLLAIVLESASGKLLTTRGLVAGMIFPKHNLDVTYPASGIAEVLVEAKMLGTPKHPGSPAEDDAGRRASADLLKRAKELAFKAVDLKAGFGLMISQQGGHQDAPAGDLATWSKSSKPKTYFLMAVRVTGSADLAACIQTSDNVAQLLDGVGIYAYTNDHLDEPAQRYSAAAFSGLSIPRSLQLEATLHTISNILAALPVSSVDQGPHATALPATVDPPLEAGGTRRAYRVGR